MCICVCMWVRERECVCAHHGVHVREMDLHARVCIWEHVCAHQCAYENMHVHITVWTPQCACKSMYMQATVEVRGQLSRAGSLLLPGRSWGESQVVRFGLLTEPSYQSEALIAFIAHNFKTLSLPETHSFCVKNKAVDREYFSRENAYRTKPMRNFGIW